MINEEKLIKKGNCKDCFYFGTTNCPDVLLMENLDLDSHSCVRWTNMKEEE